MSGVGWAWTHGAPATAVLWTLGLAWFAVCSGVLVRTDLREHRLSNRWTLRLALGGLAMMTGGALLAGRGDLALCSLLGGLGYTVAMLALHVLSRGGLGMGDVKLAGGLGVYTGVLGPTAVLAAGVDTIMLDNFSPAELRAGVELVAGRAVVEASGGVSLETIGAIAATGVDVISVGALTHTVQSLDLGLDAVVEEGSPRR